MSQVYYPRFSGRLWPRLLPCVLAAGLLMIWPGWWAAVPLWVVAGWLVARFFDPYREIPSTPMALVSPVDGVVESVARVNDDYINRQALKLRLGVHWFGAYSLRSPAEGKVQDLGRLPPEADCCGRMRIHTDEGHDVVMVLRGGRWARRGLVRVPVGERVGQGQRLGSTRGLHAVELYVQDRARARIEPGARVRAGSDTLALLNHD